MNLSQENFCIFGVLFHIVLLDVTWLNILDSGHTLFWMPLVRVSCFGMDYIYSLHHKSEKVISTDLQESDLLVLSIR